MDFRSIYTKRQLRSIAAFTINEFIVGSAIAGMIILGVVNVTIFAARSFEGLNNYIQLDTESRKALDLFTRDVRMSEGLSSFSTNKIVLSYTNSTTLTYEWDQQNEQLISYTLSETNTLLDGCDYLEFMIFQRNPIPGSYDQIPTANNISECKLVQVEWRTYRTLLGSKAHTENVQSAKVVIRNK